MGPEDIERALAGDPEAMDELLDILIPVIQVEVGFMLLDYARPSGRDPCQDLDDLVHGVWVHLLENDGRELRRFDDTRGPLLENLVRVIARRRVIDIFRSRRRNPYTEEPTDAAEQLSGDDDIERELAAVERLDRLQAAVDEHYGERGRLLFHLLYVQERSVAEVCELLGTTPSAIYNWRARFRTFLASLEDPDSDEAPEDDEEPDGD